MDFVIPVLVFVAIVVIPAAALAAKKRYNKPAAVSTVELLPVPITVNSLPGKVRYRTRNGNQMVARVITASSDGRAVLRRPGHSQTFSRPLAELERIN